MKGIQIILWSTLLILLTDCSGGKRNLLIGTWTSDEAGLFPRSELNIQYCFDDKYMCVASLNDKGEYVDTDIIQYTWKSENTFETADHFLDGQLAGAGRRLFTIKTLTKDRLVLELDRVCCSP